MQQHLQQIKPALYKAYVQSMMQIIGQGLVASQTIDAEIKKEFSEFPSGYIFSMSVFPKQCAFTIQVQDDKTLKLLNHTDQKPDLTITFKHIYHAYMVFSFQESTAQAFANDRMVADGDLSYAIRLVRCLDQMESLILPKVIASKAVKAYPEHLTLKAKLSSASKIYLHIAQSWFKRSR